MTNPKAQEHSIHDVTFGSFAKSVLPLYVGSSVTIRIGSASNEYTLPKALLSKQSPYFAATFEGSFKESEEQSTTLEEIDGVVSTRSFEMLAQWICIGHIVFEDPKPEEAITTAIEFARLADMCGVTGMESTIAERIKAVILDNQLPKSTKFLHQRDPNSNTHLLTPNNIASAVNLPKGHPVRRILAIASVEGYLRYETYEKCKLLNGTSVVPEYSVDVLEVVKAALKDLSTKNAVVFTEPITGERLSLRE